MGDTEENKGTSDNNPPSGDGSGKIGKIHANWIIFLLVLIGCAVLPICIIAGIWIVQKIGGWVIGWECLGIDDPSNNIYFTDFLGGALGFMVGFILDKFVIERINNVLHYKALMRVVRQELDNIQDTANEFEKEFSNGKIIDIKEYILDDVVMTAETMSVIANIPFATEQEKQLTMVLSNIQKYIELYCGSIRKIIEFVDVYISGEFSKEKINFIMEKLIAVKASDNKTNEIILEKSDDEINEIMEIMEKLPDGKFSEEQIKYIMEIMEKLLDSKFSEEQIKYIMEIMEKLPDGKFSEEQIKYIMEIMEKLSDGKFSEEQIKYIRKTIDAAFELRKHKQAQTNKGNSREQAMHTCRKDIPSISTYREILIKYIDKAKLIV